MTNKKQIVILNIIIVGLFIPFTSFGQHETTLEVINNLPTKISQFIPIGYSAIDTASGNLNLDSLKDMILVLRKDGEDSTSNFANDKPDKRPLLILLGQPNNTYKVAYRNDNAVYCIDCGGMFGDPFKGITIKNGYFSIEHGISGGEHWEQITTFKFDKFKSNWFLYKDHYISYKFNDSNDNNADALVKDVDKLETVKNFGIISFDKFNIYNKNGH
jgi:hypothetical protein